ncbi:MAG: hypothetical protein JKY16_00385 [Lutibacter sp.]|nr:hypothetical protein [Lutibacter sp.]
MSQIRTLQSKEISSNSIRIYINTIIPYFQFKNKLGRVVIPIRRCIAI